MLQQESPKADVVSLGYGTSAPACDTGSMWYNASMESDSQLGLVGPELEAEGVKEEKGLEYKGAFIRVVGLAIDLVVLFIFSLIVGAIFGTERSAAYVLLAIVLIYLVGFWRWRGQTLGKMIIGAKIVKVNGDSIGWGRAFLRFVGYFLYFLAADYGYYYVGWALIVVVLFIAFIITGLSSKKRGLHDLLAGTCVVKSR